MRGKRDRRWPGGWPGVRVSAPVWAEGGNPVGIEREEKAIRAAHALEWGMGTPGLGVENPTEAAHDRPNRKRERRL